MANIGYAEMTTNSAWVQTSNDSVLKFTDSPFAFFFVLTEQRQEKEAGGCDSWIKPPFWIQIWIGPESIHSGLEHHCVPPLKSFTELNARWMPLSCTLAELGWDFQAHLGTGRNGTRLPRLERSLNPKKTTQKANVYFCKNTHISTVKYWRLEENNCM